MRKSSIWLELRDKYVLRTAGVSDVHPIKLYVIFNLIDKKHLFLPFLTALELRNHLLKPTMEKKIFYYYIVIYKESLI